MNHNADFVEWLYLLEDSATTNDELEVSWADEQICRNTSTLNDLNDSTDERVPSPLSPIPLSNSTPTGIYQFIIELTNEASNDSADDGQISNTQLLNSAQIHAHDIVKQLPEQPVRLVTCYPKISKRVKFIRRDSDENELCDTSDDDDPYMKM